MYADMGQQTEGANGKERKGADETSIQPRQEEAKAKECVLKEQACRQATRGMQRPRKGC